MPAALGQLSRLQLFHLGRASTAAQASALPSGPWLRSLRWLSADTQTLLGSMETLHAAAALECVSIAGVPLPAGALGWQSPAADALFDWLARHPPLQRLSLECLHFTKTVESGSFLLQFAQLCRRRPQLAVQCPTAINEGQTLIEHLRVCHRF